MQNHISSLSNKSYPKDTVGAAMSENIPTVKTTDSILTAKNLITEHPKDFDSLNYVYVIDSENKLSGVVSIKNLLSAENTSEEIKTLIKAETLISTHPYSHQEKAATLAIRNNIKAVPVVDKEGHLLGVVTSDKILSITHQEMREDILKFAGLNTSSNAVESSLDMSLKRSLILRLPWIIIGFLGGLVIARTIGSFEETLQQNIVIATFIPLMVYMSNAVGQQMTAFVIRDSAMDHEIKFGKYFKKQFGIVLIIASLMGGSLFLFGSLAIGNPRVAGVLGGAMFTTIMSSLLSGLLIPYSFIKLKMDPAGASGPIGTVFQDFMSVLIYFTIATLLL